MKISDLNPVEYNPRTISKENLERLKASIRAHSPSVEGADRMQYRLAATVTINRQGDRIVGGHKRLLALAELGQEDVHATDLTWVDLEPGSDGEKALCIALNARDAQGLFRWDQVAAIAEYLRQSGAEWVAGSGFSEATLASIAAERYEAPDAPPEGEEDPTSDHDIAAASIRELKIPGTGREVMEAAIAKAKAAKPTLRTNAEAVEMFCGVWLEVQGT